MLSKVVLNFCTFTQWSTFVNLRGLMNVHFVNGLDILHCMCRTKVMEVDPYFKSTFPTKQNNMFHLTIISMLGLVHLSLWSCFINAIALELKTIHVIKLQRMYLCAWASIFYLTHFH